MFPSDPFQRLTASGTFQRILDILAQRYDLFLIITGITFVPAVFFVISVLVAVGSSTYIVMDDLGSQQNISMDIGFDDASSEASPSISSESAAAIRSLIGNMLGQLFLEEMVFLLLSISGKAAMTYAVAELYSGRDSTWLDCFKKGFSKWCDIFGAVAIACFAFVASYLVVDIIVVLFFATKNSFMIFIGIAITIVWLVLLALVKVSLMMVMQVILVEGKGPINSLRRSWELSMNNQCYIFCTVFSIHLSSISIQLIIILLFSGNGDAILSIFEVLLIALPRMIYIPLKVM